jgi:hypothetical protein
LFNTSGLWQSEGLYFITEESSSTSFAATKVYVRFGCVQAAKNHYTHFTVRIKILVDNQSCYAITSKNFLKEITIN